MRRHIARSTALVASLMCVLLVLTAQSSQAVAHDTIEGSGSSWSALAVWQWAADVKAGGLQVGYNAPGSATGRKDFANKTTDFAVSDIGFRGVTGGEQDTNQGRAYAYLPIVAGGTSFPYNLTFGGKRVTNLRLSGLTLVKIFTGGITSWSDAAITADNNGRRLPALPIVPLVHAEGSGSTAQLTTYFDTMFPSVWRKYQGVAGFTEYYPKNVKGMIAQSGSDQIINYATSAAANGVITYDEYSYATAKKFPVAKVENAAGYFTLPTQYNVAVALTKAQINMDTKSPDYLLQNLTNVYRHPDKRTYPLSSYSYMIIPTGASDPRMNTAKRQTLVDYLYYAVCTGQKEMGPIGYSPLPINLVQASFDQTNKLKAADPAVDITKRDVSTCHNPTFVAGNTSRNLLAEIAPLPPACDYVKAGPCTGGANLAILGNPNGGKAPGAPGGTAGGAAGGTAGGAAGGAAGGPAGGAPGSTAAGGAAAAGAAVPKAGGAIDPATGQLLASGASGSGIDGSQSAVTTDLASASAVSGSTLTTLTIIILLLAITMPPMIGSTLTKRKVVGR